jgi:hypothetical protein
MKINKKRRTKNDKKTHCGNSSKIKEETHRNIITLTSYKTNRSQEHRF